MAPHLALGMAVNLDAVQGVNLLWGATSAIYNLFSKTSMQPAAMVYAANCSIVAGESAGWQATLRNIAKRMTNGYRLGELEIGYPGKHFIYQVLEAPYGCRWLGILAVASSVRSEGAGAKGLYRFLLENANKVTSQYVLDLEQTEKMWNLGREIFLDSPVHHEFLRIVASCTHLSKSDFLHYAYPNERSDSEFVAGILTAGLKLWEMARVDSRNKMCARGSIGIAHLVLYLSAVCGFNITVQLDEKDGHFGNESDTTEVVIIFDREQRAWDVGFITDCSLDDAVQYWLGADNQSAVWMPGRASFAQASPSTYALMEAGVNLTSYGAVNLADLIALQKTLHSTRNDCGASYWLANYLHRILSSTRLVATDVHEPTPLDTRIDTRIDVLWERALIANDLFGVGLIQGTHLNELSDKLKKRTPPESLGSLSSRLAQSEARLLCSCQHHGGSAGGIAPCRILTIQWQLEDLAWKMWVCAHTQEGCQRILRDIGPNREWNIMNRLGMFPGNDAVPSTMQTSIIMACVAERLAGRFFPSLSKNILGIVSGGAIIALKCYETQPVHLDPGHCFYILPGSIDTTVRRVTEVHDAVSSIQSPSGGVGLGKWGNAMELSSLQRPLNGFGDCQFDHVVHLERGTAHVSTIVRAGEKIIRIGVLDAIDQAPCVRTIDGCLGECAAGKLNDSEINQVRVVDASNYGALVDVAGSTRLRPQLDLILAHGNVAVQRAVISRPFSSPCLLQMGQCVHCAVRDALMRNAKVLLD